LLTTARTKPPNAHRVAGRKIRVETAAAVFIPRRAVLSLRVRKAKKRESKGTDGQADRDILIEIHRYVRQ